MTDQKRLLRFKTFDAVIADITHLRSHGYRKLKSWSLEQMCFHLAKPIPVPLRTAERIPEQPAVIARLRHYAEHGSPPPGATAPPGSEPPENPPQVVTEDLITRLLLVAHFGGNDVDMGPRGSVPTSIFKPFVLGHCGHHLGFLLPNE